MKARTVKNTLKISGALWFFSLCMILFGQQIPPQVWAGGVIAPLLFFTLAVSSFVSVLCLQILMVSTLMLDEAMTRPLKQRARFINKFFLATLTEDAKLKHSAGLEEIANHKIKTKKFNWLD